MKLLNKLPRWIIWLGVAAWIFAIWILTLWFLMTWIEGTFTQ